MPAISCCAVDWMAASRSAAESAAEPLFAGSEPADGTPPVVPAVAVATVRLGEGGVAHEMVATATTAARQIPPTILAMYAPRCCFVSRILAASCACSTGTLRQTGATLLWAIYYNERWRNLAMLAPILSA
jgi:hypothetical protein